MGICANHTERNEVKWRQIFLHYVRQHRVDIKNIRVLCQNDLAHEPYETVRQINGKTKISQN